MTYQPLSDAERSGVALIAAERQRQIDVEGWSPDHDAERAEAGALARAAALYVEAGLIAARLDGVEGIVRRAIIRNGGDPDTDEDFARMKENPARHYFGWDKAPREWPWHVSWWKPSPDPIRNLVKAGALIAAEIDRLGRATSEQH